MKTYSNAHNRNTLPLINQTYYSDPSKHAIVSTLTSDAYTIAVAVLAHSALEANTSARLILTYPENSTTISASALCIARVAGWELHPVPLIPAPNGGKGVTQHRYLEMFTKLQIWGLDSIVERVVYLDADMLVMRNFDELFALPWDFGAVPDVYTNGRGFDTTFNAGVLALRTSSHALEEMRRVLGDLNEEAKEGRASIPPAEAEQAFLNAYYAADVVRLPYVYNANLAIKQESPVLWDTMVAKKEIRVVHYTLVKPFVIIKKVDSRGGDEMKVVLGEELKKINLDARGKHGGLWREEMTWWWSAYERMMLEKGDEIRECLL
ncbi:glycosyltransferase family 8 protein [Athelia psychrophila]|uniref:Glycosyltransferase family 8 protein n=1 Tax=Athelia psychrophila TaxID=1759441 RepID=A0A166J5U2_9AGAM|nr:glycosyltransferase family 8 protein [Fibularhizoctonia sp. CBS 109695]